MKGLCKALCGARKVHLPFTICVQDADLYHEKTRYFGLSELLELTNSGSGLPLMRYDSSFETMATALEEKYVKTHVDAPSRSTDSM